MPRSRIRLIHASPGAANLQPLISRFCAGEEGILTCLSDSRLRMCRELVPEEAEVEVLPFGEVTGRFLGMAGGRPMPMAQNGHVLAAIAEACEHLPLESPFLQSAHFPGAHARIQSALEELLAWGVDTDEMERLAAAAATPYLAGKLRSLAFISRDIAGTLSQLGRQLNAERIRDCVAIQPKPEARFSKLMVVAGSEAEPQQIEFVKWAACCTAVTVVVDAHPRVPGTFSAASRWASALEVDPEHEGTLNSVAASVFSAPLLEPDRHQPVNVQIRTAADPLAEAEWAIRGCLREVQDGINFSDIAILARNLESYAPVLESAARRLGVPIRVSRRSALLTNSLAKLTLHLLEFCASDDVREIARTLRSSYLGLTEESQSTIRAAAYGAFSNGRRQWEELEQWVAQQEEFGWLRELLEWRKEALRESATLRQWVDERFRRLGEIRQGFTEFDPTALRDNNAQSAMYRVLSQTASIVGVRSNPQLELRDFVRLCRRLWSEEDMSLPAREFGVRVVRSAEELPPVGSLYVLGMLEGVFPRRRSEDPILTDAERHEISKARGGLPMQDSHDRARQERDEFLRVCAAAGSRLVFSYPLTDEDRDNVPAFYLTEVKNVAEVDSSDYKRSKLTPQPDECIALADQALCEAIAAEREDPLPNILQTEGAAAVIRGPEVRSYHVKELRDVLQCPFQYTVKWPMKLRTQPSHSRWVSLLRLPQEARLASQLSRESAVAALEQQLETEVMKVYAEASPHELATMRSGGRRLIAEWVEREFLSRDIWPREKVVEWGTKMGSEYIRNTVKTPSGKVMLEGDVPAVSERDGYLIAHLYKSSDPLDDNFARRRDADLPWRELKPRESFEVGLYLLALARPKSGVGVEIDSMTGQRRLFVMPRREPPLQNPQEQGFRVMPVDASNMPDLVRDIVPLIERAVARISEPMVEAIPDEHCTYCEYGELCRRSRDFGEVVDPLEEDDYEPAE